MSQKGKIKARNKKNCVAGDSGKRGKKKKRKVEEFYVPKNNLQHEFLFLMNDIYLVILFQEASRFSWL